MARHRWMILTLLFAAGFPAESRAQQLPPDAMARFYINEASYWTDVGKYLEALEDLNTAFDTAQDPAIRAEASSQKATLLLTFLDDPPAAVREYDGILQNFQNTAFYEPAIFQSGFARYSAGDPANAAPLFQRYLREFPRGGRATTATFMLERIARNLPLPSPDSRPPLKVDPPGNDRPKPARTVSSTRIRIALKNAKSVTVSSAMALTRDGHEAGLTVTVNLPDLHGSSRIASTAPLLVDGIRYRGDIVLWPDTSTILVVNEVPLEDYIASVLNSEMPSHWPAEALKAQAVAARTYASYHMAHPHDAARFDVFDDTRSQAYNGARSETAAGRQAVDATRGEILTYEGKPLLAYFTANNGGTTADPEAVFGKAFPYLKFVPDSYSSQQQWGKWTRTFSLAAVEAALQKAGYGITGIRRIIPVKTCPSGRLVELIVEHANGQKRLHTRTEFRRAINMYAGSKMQPENLPEILMSIKIAGAGSTATLEMTGGGWGHGVGLSQYGAKGMAEQKVPYRKILNTYYPGAQLSTAN